MKKIFSFIAVVLLFTNALVAQESITVKMSMHIEGLPPEMAAMGDMEIINYSKGDKLKSENSSMMGSSVSVMIGDKITVLNDMMGNKMGYVSTRQEMESTDKNKSTNTKIEYINEKKTIAGYECSKAILTYMEDKKEMKVVIWYTDKLDYKNNAKMKNQGRKGFDISELKGFPLSMEFARDMNGQSVTMIMTTTSVSTESIADSVFEVSTEGYKMMTYQEMMSKQKMGMGGSH